jgi:hypothetical protein
MGAESVLRNWQSRRESRNFPPFTQPECSLPCSQTPLLDSYPEPLESSPQLHSYISLILSFHMSPKSSLSFRFSGWNFVSIYHLLRSRGSSVSIVTDYGLNDRSSIPDRGRGFFFQSLRPDRLWGPPSLLSNGYQGSFPRVKARPGRDADHSPPSSTEVKYE